MRHFSTFLFIFALVCGVSLVLLRTKNEVQRADYLSQLPEWSSDTPDADATSATGYQSGQRVSIVPGHDKCSFDAIAITQKMLAERKFSIDRIDYANTPLGHPAHLASLHPWVLKTSAWFHQHLSGGAIGRCVETAARRLNSNLLLFGLVTAALLAASVFGRLPAALLALGMAVIFPFAAAFVPGAPHPLSLNTLCMLFSLLALLAGTVSSQNSASAIAAAQETRTASARGFYAASGVFGALGLWLDVPSALPFLGGIAASGVLLSFLSPALSAQTLPWRTWAAAGAGTVLLGYFIDFFPAQGGEVLRYIHPLYALAWIGAAEILLQCGKANGQAKNWNRKRAVICGIAAVALLQLPIILLYSKTALYIPDGPDAFKLEPLSNVAAPSIAVWLAKDGFSKEAVAAFLPLLVVPFAIYILYRIDSARRVAIGLALGPVIACLGVGTRQLSHWSHIDVALLALMVGLITTLCRIAHWRLVWVTAVLFVLCLTPGLFQVLKPNPANASLSPPEFESYIERDLAHWLRQHSTKTPAVLAPPRVTSALCFYGGFSGLSTFDRENQAGTSAAIRIVSASSREEAFTLVDSRKLTHIIIPFWDTYLNTYLGLGLGADAEKDRLEISFLAILQRWQLPPWVRAIPYRLPPGPGVDGMIVILEIVDEQPPALADARLAEYFVEMDMLDRAKEQTKNLVKYPNDWGALAAACMVATATNDVTALEAARGKLFSAVERPERRRLVWDRRVSLAIVLAQQKRPELAKAQMEKCLAEITADNLRSLTTVSLYRFNLLCKLYGTEIDDPDLKTLSRKLLRPDLRIRL